MGTPNIFGSINPNFSNNNLSLLGLSGLAGAFPTPASGTSSTSSSSAGLSTPVLSPEAQALIRQLSGQYAHLAGTGTNLQPYQDQQIQQINTNSGFARRAAEEALAARGLSDSPIAGTVAANQEGSRIGEITNLQQSIPLLQNQLSLQNMGAAGSFAASIPHGESTQVNSNQNTATTTKTGGGISGAAGGFGSALGAILGAGKFFSDKRLKENVTDTTDGLEKVLKMKPKQYNYKGDNEAHSGFMAQDLEGLFPETVSNHESGFKMVKYHELMPKIVKAIQELHSKVESNAKDAKSTKDSDKVTKKAAA